MSWEADLLRDLTPLIPELSGRVAHLAMMREPYMSRVADGTKTIESRWGKVRCAPHGGRVRPNDIIIFKPAGKPIRGWTEVAEVVSLEDPTPEKIEHTIELLGPSLGVDAGFAASVAGSRFVTLCWLYAFTAIDARRITIGKTDRRGWVRLGAAP